MRLWLNVLALTLAILTFQFSSALTASIGNSRMVIHLESGQTVEKYILVKNVNEGAVSINLSASGDLEKNVQFREKSFKLSPKEEKRAYFTIRSEGKDTTETRIHVLFTDEEGKSVGLASIVTLVVNDTTNGSEEALNYQDETNDNSENSEQNNDNGDEDDEDSDSDRSGGVVYENENTPSPDERQQDQTPPTSVDTESESNKPLISGGLFSGTTPAGLNPMTLLLVTTILLVILLIMLLVIATRRVPRRKRLKEAHA